jgi:quercetin dioxygenase-like cupin family protein
VLLLKRRKSAEPTSLTLTLWINIFGMASLGLGLGSGLGKGWRMKWCSPVPEIAMTRPALGCSLFLLGFVVLSVGPSPALAQTPAPVSTPVDAFDATVSEQPIVLPQGPVRLTVTQTDLAAGGLIPPHKHPWPRYNYVLAGAVRVTNLDTGAVQDFKAGQVIVEAVGQWHKGEALGGPVRLLAFDQTPPGESNMVRMAP